MQWWHRHKTVIYRVSFSDSSFQTLSFTTPHVLIIQDIQHPQKVEITEFPAPSWKEKVIITALSYTQRQRKAQYFIGTH